MAINHEVFAALPELVVGSGLKREVPAVWTKIDIAFFFGGAEVIIRPVFSVRNHGVGLFTVLGDICPLLAVRAEGEIVAAETALNRVVTLKVRLPVNDKKRLTKFSSQKSHVLAVRAEDDSSPDGIVVV